MMDSPEGISMLLKQLELKKNKLREAILMVAQESKAIDGQLDLTKESFDDCVTDLNLKGKILESNQNSIIESNRELSEVRESLELRLRELECREEEFHSFQQTQLEEIKIKSEKLAETGMWVVKKLQEVEMKEERLNEQKRLMEALLDKFHIKEQELDNIKKSISEELDEIGMKRRNLQQRSKELSLKEEKVEMGEKQLTTMKMQNEQRCQELDEKWKQLLTKEKQLEEASKDFELTEKQLEKHTKKIVLEENLLKEKFNVLDSKKKPLEEKSKQLEVREKQLRDLAEESGLKEELTKKQSKETNSHVNVDRVKGTPALKLPAGVISMNGKCLQLYLNENFRNYETLCNAVHQILQLSFTLPELVLDAIEGSYPHLKKGEVEFEESVMRKSCTHLLKKLMILSPPMTHNVKERALALAVNWKMKIDLVSRKPLEVLAYILLLASFKLASNFNVDEILQLLLFIPVRKEAPELCKSLCLLEKVPDFIRRLVERNLHLEAIEYVYTFDLENEFPPATLFTAYISYEQGAAWKILQDGNYSVKARDIAYSKELYALKAVMSCIKLHKLEPPFPLGSIIERIQQLERHKIELQTLAPHSSLIVRLEERFDSRREERSSKKHKVLHPQHALNLQM